MERPVATGVGVNGGEGSIMSKDATEARIALECNQRIKRWHTSILAFFLFSFFYFGHHIAICNNHMR